MGTAVTALLDVEDYLKSLKYKFTQAEADALESVKGKLFRNFFLGAGAATAAVWAATRRFGWGHRINLAGGAGIFSGFIVFRKSFDSVPEKVLSLEGSHLQSEFAKILLIKHGDNPRTMQVIEKYFYKEHVYDDSTVDRTIARWRHRSFFGENSAPGQRKHDDVYGADADTEQKQVVDPTPSPITAVTLKSSVEVSTDPFDCLFGYSEALEEKSRRYISPEVPPKRRTRSHKKTARRHRKHHSEHEQAESERR
ncbi:hypothetical protein MKW98_003549 [Papaver atlanticum]|uniref:Uncharacterized protein n=1 Tax=Papaver atlanticum TaxID=357466 RepID=A0AAD4TCX3_9MAGN|nr:hypothetical protein MKW98_003549 [Papaver atlanticum]